MQACVGYSFHSVFTANTLIYQHAATSEFITLMTPVLRRAPALWMLAHWTSLLKHLMKLGSLLVQWNPYLCFSCFDKTNNLLWKRPTGNEMQMWLIVTLTNGGLCCRLTASVIWVWTCWSVLRFFQVPQISAKDMLVNWLISLRC